MNAHGNRGSVSALRRAFTLIEMLVVVVVIAILAGIVFRMISLAARSGDRARTIARVQRVSNAVESFHAEYGQYPPVPYYGNTQPFRYEYPTLWGMRPGIRSAVTTQNPAWDEAPILTFGLMSFLLARYDGRAARVVEQDGYAQGSVLDIDQWNEYNKDYADLAQDKAAMQRWMPQIEELLHVGWHAHDRPAIGGAYTNATVTVRDAWDQGLHYESPPPHQTYRIWSNGPNNEGANNVSRRIGYGRWDE